MNELKSNVMNATNLDDLCAALNACVDVGVRTDEIIDTTDLPTFGGTAPARTEGIYSWDADRQLVQGASRWEIEARG